MDLPEPRARSRRAKRYRAGGAGVQRRAGLSGRMGRAGFMARRRVEAVAGTSARTHDPVRSTARPHDGIADHPAGTASRGHVRRRVRGELGQPDTSASASAWEPRCAATANMFTAPTCGPIPGSSRALTRGLLRAGAELRGRSGALGLTRGDRAATRAGQRGDVEHVRRPVRRPGGPDLALERRHARAELHSGDVERVPRPGVRPSPCRREASCATTTITFAALSGGPTPHDRLGNHAAGGADPGAS